MFEIGFSELLMVGLVGLLVIGPERLPRAARIAGFWLGKTQRMAANLKAEIHRELQVEDMRQLFEEQQSALKDYKQLYDEVSDAAHEVRSSFWRPSETDALSAVRQIPGRIYDDMAGSNLGGKPGLWQSPQTDGIDAVAGGFGEASEANHQARPALWQAPEADGVKDAKQDVQHEPE